MGQDPGVVLVPMFHDQPTLPDPSAVLGPRPWAPLGPLLYVTTIVQAASGFVDTVTWPTPPRDTGLRTETNTTETVGLGAAGVGVGVTRAVEVIVGETIGVGARVFVEDVRGGVVDRSCAEMSVGLATDLIAGSDPAADPHDITATTASATKARRIERVSLFASRRGARGSPDPAARRRSRVARLVHPELPAAGKRQTRQESPALVRDRLALDAPSPQLGDERIDVVGHEVELVPVVRVRGMDRELRGGQAEDKPAVADIDAWEPQHVAQEGAIRFGIGAVDDGVGAADHIVILIACRRVCSR